ncbi:MAG: guanylate kinase [Nitrospiraceae bacterium]|nr:MAG: guanylate kinase [Nitrospiraceae bacterium]
MKKSQPYKTEGTLFVISAPSGAGKSTLCRELLRKVLRIKLSVSYTTRPPRRGEINDVHYTFVSREKFKSMIDRGEFAEWAVVHGNLYGTSLKRLKKLNKEGYDIILDVDVQGAGQLRKTCTNAVYVFVLPPSMKVLKKRLMDRNTEETDKIKQRLDRARDEIAAYKDYDYIIVNDKLEKAYRELESVIVSTRLETKNADRQMIKSLLK